MRVVCLLFQNCDSIGEIAEACYRWTPQVAVRKDEAIFLEIEQCQKISKEENILLKFQGLLRRFGARARISISHDPSLSLALSRFSGFKGEPYELPLQALYDIASPFKKDFEINKQVEILIYALEKLGVKNLKSFMELQPKALASRFHYLGLSLYRRLTSMKRGEDTGIMAAWPAFIPPEKIIESIVLHDHDNCQNLEPLLFILKNLVSRVMARLAGRGERLTSFELKFDLEKYSTIKSHCRRWVFQMPLPQGSLAGLFPLIQEKLYGDLDKNPLEGPVTTIELHVLETVPGRYAQRNFFDKGESSEEWNSLMARLCQKLGKDQAFIASPVETYRPESAWMRSWSEIPPELASGDGLTISPVPERPLRLLKKPQPLIKIHNSLLQEGPGIEKRWEIYDWEGPERLDGEWWSDEVKRDYFRVGTQSGEQLWIFRIPETDKIFLHGFFD